MKKTKSLIVTGLIVAAITVVGISTYAAEETTDETGIAVERCADGTHMGHQGQRGQRGGFDKAVEEGILTEAEVEAIQAYHEENSEDRDVLKAELEGMTRDEAQAYMEENYPRSEDPMADLVAAGLISQEKADLLVELREEAQANRPEKSEMNANRPAFGGQRQGSRPTTR